MRHVVDFAYVSFGFCQAARPGWPCALNASVAAQTAQMADFALTQVCTRRILSGEGGIVRIVHAHRRRAPSPHPQLALPSRTWMHALSPNDTLGYIARPDHGTTGAYLRGGFPDALGLLTGTAAVTREGPYGQAHMLDAALSGAYKTSSGWTRYTSNCGGAYAEVVVRTFFGYEPGWLAQSGPAPALADWPRGVNATLSCLRGPGSAGYASATIGGGSCVAYSPWLPEC